MKHWTMVGLLAPLLLWAVAACNILGENPPEIGQIEIQGAPGDSVELIVSTVFIAGPSQERDTILVEILEADTVRRRLPYRATVDISEYQRLFVRVTDSDSTDAIVTMRVAIDGESLYDESAIIEQRLLQFIYVYNQGPVTVEPRL